MRHNINCINRRFNSLGNSCAGYATTNYGGSAICGNSDSGFTYRGNVSLGPGGHQHHRWSGRYCSK